MWKIDLRTHDGAITRTAETADPELAVEAYRRLLRRTDLDGQPVAARMVSPITRKSIYYSRFDPAPGALRIHPDAPIDPFADGDWTARAAAWRPAEAAGGATDYETDPRPLAEVLKEVQVALNGGRVHGGRDRLADELRVGRPTYDAWLAGRSPSEAHERLIRRVLDEMVKAGQGRSGKGS